VTDWWAGLAPAQTTIPCGGLRHRLRWEAGTLRALDHDDLDGERTLAALGGERCACVEVVDAWARHAADPAVLLLGRRAPTDALAAGEDQAPWAPASAAGPSGAVGWTMYTPVRGSMGYLGVSTPTIQPAEPDSTAEIAGLLTLGGGLGDRLVATVAAHFRERVDEARVPLHATLYGRLLAGAILWLAEPELELQLELVADDAPRRIVRADDGVRAELPYAWLPDVWTRDLGVVAGRLVLDAVSEDDGRRWRLAAVGPDLGGLETVGLALTG